MDSQKDLNQKILKTLTKIREEHPELTKYLTEMPVVHSEKDEVNTRALKEYHDSLVKLLNSYADKHD